MAAPVILVEATPRRAIDGAQVTVRLAGGGGDRPYRYGGEHWRAGIAGLPKSVSSLDFDGEQLGGGGVAQALELRWSPGSNAALAELAALFWTDAPIVVRIGDEDDVLPPIDTTGIVLETAIDGGALRIALADATTDLKRPLLVDRYAGTGGIEGPVEWEGAIKSRAWGRCFNVPGRAIDVAHDIWCFGDPTRAWNAFVEVRDKGVAASADTLTVLAWQGSVAATFAALQAAPATAGGGVLCPSIACVKWWTAPAGDLRADIRGETAGGYVETAPEIAARIVAARSTLAFAPGAIAAAVVARPAPFGWRVETDGSTAAAEISELLGGVSLSWLIVDDAVIFRPWDWSASTRTVRSQAVTRSQVYKPVATRKLGYRRNWSPMARGDLAAIVLARDVIYEDGASAETLQPATIGATVGAPIGTTIGGTIQPDSTVSGGTPVVEVIAQLDQIEPLAIDVSALQDAKVGTDAALQSLLLADIDQDAARRQADRAVGKLDEALLRLLSESARTRAVLRDAGVVVDPATGVVRIYAVDQLAERTSTAEIALDATKATVATKASVNYVNEQIALAVLDPVQAAQLGAIIGRLTSAEQTIDGLNASVSLKADAVTVTQLGGIVTGVSQELDALAGTVATKAEQTVVDQLGIRTGSVEQTLSALGNVSGISVTVRQARMVADDAATAGLRALIAGDSAARRQIVAAAEARQDVYTRIGDGLASEATARTLLAVTVGALDARTVQQIQALVNADGALSRRIDAQAVTSDTQGAAIATLSTASIDAKGGLAGVTMTIRQQAGRQDTSDEALLRALIAGDVTGQARAAQLVQIQNEFSTSLVAGESASAVARQALLARMAAAEAAVVSTAKGAADANAATARQATALEARLDSVGSVGIEQAFAATVDRLGNIEGTATLAIDTNGNLVGTRLVGSSVGLGSLQLINADLRMGSGRIVLNTGTFMQVQGIGFGADGDLVEWFGPAMPIAMCSRANAKTFKTITGDAYFGGSLSVGTLRNAVGTSLTTPNAAVQLGPFASNGGVITVAISYAFSHSYRCDAGTGFITGPIGATLTSSVGGLTAYETDRLVDVDGDPSVPDLVRYEMSGGLTVQTTIGITTSAMLSAALASRTLPNAGGVHIATESIRQQITIIATEG